MEVSKRMRKELTEQFGHLPLFCQQLLFEVDLYKTKLSRIYESNFEIIGNNFEKPIYLEDSKESHISFTSYGGNKLGFEIKNPMSSDGEKYVSIGMYKKRDLPRLAIADKLSVDTGTEFFIETNWIKKEITHELRERGREIERSYTISENIKDVVSLNMAMREKNIHIGVWIYNAVGFAPIVIMKNVSNLVAVTGDRFSFKKHLIADPFIDEITDNRYLYNSTLSPVNVTKLELTNFKESPLIKQDYYLNYKYNNKETK